MTVEERIASERGDLGDLHFQRTLFIFFFRRQVAKEMTISQQKPWCLVQEDYQGWNWRGAIFTKQYTTGTPFRATNSHSQPLNPVMNSGLVTT